MTEMLWTESEIVSLGAGELRGALAMPVNGASIDTRTLARGDIFFAIMGKQRDGHDFVAAAFEKGAGLAVVSEPTPDMEKLGPLYVVGDTLRAMEAFGVHARARCGGRVAAITGSVGKTGTKEALRQCLDGQGRVHASAASYNNHWGVPLTLARLPADAEFGIFEIGMNRPGEITPLSRMVSPHVAVVTTVAPVHLGAFSRVEEIADAKAEIFDGLRKGGTAILNVDNVHFDRLKSAAVEAGAGEIIRFGESKGADAALLEASLQAEGSVVRAAICGEDVTYKIGAPGRHLVLNSLAVLAAAVALGGDLALSALALANWHAPKGRGERLVLEMPGGTVTIIDESYNANPASMRAALALLGLSEPGRGGRRIAVLGDMLELGDASREHHGALAGDIEAADADLVLACGKDMAALWESLPASRRGTYAESSDGLEAALLDAVQPGDVLVVKGSLGSRMGPLVKALKSHFQESKR